MVGWWIAGGLIAVGLAAKLGLAVRNWWRDDWL